MPTHVPPQGPPIDDQAMLGGMGAMLGGAPPADPMGGDPMAGATNIPGNEGEDAQVIAALAMENVQLRAMLGLGPDDPVPMDPEMGGAPGMPAPGMEQGAPAF